MISFQMKKFIRIIHLLKSKKEIKLDKALSFSFIFLQHCRNNLLKQPFLNTQH